jgi:hypothetical protein
LEPQRFYDDGILHERVKSGFIGALYRSLGGAARLPAAGLQVRPNFSLS